jgi:hypothetical protein
MGLFFKNIVSTLLISCCTIVSAACPGTEKNLLNLAKLKASEWQMNDAALRQQTALDMLDCLASPNPQLRDELAFEALAFWMRGELLSIDTIHQIRRQLLVQVAVTPTVNDDGFVQPFAALVLAEVARVDRRKPFMTELQRTEMVNAAAEYLSFVNDFRGYDENSGWRHGVAHGADWMMQLSLNPSLNKRHHEIMLGALAKQIRNDRHFYQYGEGERLMTPVFYLGLRSSLSNEEWDSWFASLHTTSLALKKTTQASLARKHNLTAFLSALYVNLHESKQVAFQEKFLPFVVKSLKKLN